MIHAIWAWVGLLARGSAEDRFRSMHRYMSEPRTPWWWTLLFWVGVLAAATLFIVLAARHRAHRNRRPPARGPWRTFFRLTRGAPLSWAQRGLLWSMARQVSPEQPSSILLSPSALSAAARTWAQQQSASPADVLARLEPIARVLFGPHTRLEVAADQAQVESAE